MNRTLVVCLAFGLATVPLMASHAQNPQPAPPGAQPAPVAPPNTATPPPEKIAPGTTQRDDQNLSDKLSRQRGTLHPPAGVDPGMTVAPPQHQGATMPVIPPPGSPGGNPRVVPK
jgi:hypothetical protein